jgi:hypothetical protein
MINIVQALLAMGAIDSPSGVATALTSQISAAGSAISSGSIQAAINILSAFEDYVHAQAGKHIVASITNGGVTFNPAAVLLADAQALIDSLRGGGIPIQ